MKRLFCVWLATLSFCFAFSGLAPIENLSFYGGLLDNCIDPVNGSWHDREVDLEVPGSTLTVTRYHSSDEPGWGATKNKNWRYREEPPLNQWVRWGWNHATLFYYLPWQRLVYVQSTTGGHLSFGLDPKHNGSIRKLILNGWNNIHSLDEGARADIHNYSICCPPGAYWKITMPDGTIRDYSTPDFSDGKKSKQVWMCAEKERTYPSGIRWRYDHTVPTNPRFSHLSCMNLTSIQEVNREGEITASLSLEQNGYKISSQTGQWVEYRCISKKCYDHMLESVTRSDGPCITYEHENPYVEIASSTPNFFGDYEVDYEHWVPPRITKKTYEGGKYRRMRYKPFKNYSTKSNPLSYPYFYGKLTGYFGPVGSNGEEEVIYELDHYDSHTRIFYGKNGKYKIEDYFRGKDNLLTKHVEYQGSEAKRTRDFYYSKNEPKGRLERESLRDENNKDQVLSYFKYDEKGNVVSKTIYGSIFDRSKSLKITKEGLLENETQVDAYEIRYEFSSCRFNLKTAEIYPDGIAKRYVYEPGTDNLTAVFVYKNDRIIQRSFYTYEKNAQISYEIHDNGSSEDAQDLTDVFERTYVNRTIADEHPYKGLILCEEKGHIDPVTRTSEALNATIYSYDSKRRIIDKEFKNYTTNSSYHLCYDYDDHNNIIRETTVRGGVIERLFDVDNCLLWEKGPDPRVERWYAYDGDRRVSSCTEKHSDYEGREWVTRYQYDALGRRTSVCDPYGVTISYTYDWAGRIIKECHSNLLDEHSLGLTEYEKCYQYDCQDRKIYEQNEKGHVTRAVFNILGLPLYRSSALGQTEEYFYNSSVELIKKRYDEGRLTEYFYYDEMGRQCRIEVDTGSERFVSKEMFYAGLKKTSEIDALGNREFWKYDPSGRIIEYKKEDALSGVCFRESWEYDGWNRIKVHYLWSDEQDYVADYFSYNNAGDMTHKWTETSLGEKFKEAYFTYDETGRCLKQIQVVEGQEYEKVFAYDSLGNIISEIDEEGYQTHWRYTYQPGNEADGRAVIAFQNRKDGSTKETELTSRGLEVSQKLFDKEGNLSQHQIFGYDLSKTLVYRREKVLSPNHPDEEEWVQTKLEYGPGNLITKRFDDYEGALQRIRLWEYDASGNCLKKTQPSGLSHHYEYDSRGFLTRCYSNDGSIDYIYEHDNLGQTTKVTNTLTGKYTERFYDAWSRITQDLSEEGELFKREWNAIGKPVKDIYPNQVEVRREYAGGLLRKTSTQSLVQTIDLYDSQAQTVCETLPFSLGQLQSKFDVKNRLTSFSSPGYSASQIQYDAMGQLTSRIINDEKEQRYTYDVLGQLSFESSDNVHLYTHDSRYRRIEKDNEVIALDNLDQIYGVIRNLEVETCEYDLDGRLIQKQIGDDLFIYTYDAWSRLISFRSPSGHFNYTYDAFDRRMTEVNVDTGDLRVFSYLGQMLAGIRSENSYHERYFVRGTGSERGDMLAWTDGENTYIPVQDMTGSCVGTVDLTGNMLHLWEYDSFGQSESQSFGPWGFWGKHQDPVTSMIYFGLRYYIPEQGRWLTRDTKGEIDGSNLYAFVRNNPVTRFDDWGAFSFSQSMSSFVNSCSSFFSTLSCCFSPTYNSEVRDARSDLVTGNLRAQESCVTIARPKDGASSKSHPTVRVNGVGTTYEEFAGQVVKTADDTGSTCYGVYNYSATEPFGGIGLPIDAARALTQRAIWNFHTGSELAVWGAVKMAFAEGTGRITILGHSYGMQVITNAERRCNMTSGIEPNAEMAALFKLADVRCLAGSGSAKNFENFNSFENNVCTNDRIIRLFDGGAIAQQREAGILKEPEPVISPDAKWWEVAKAWIVPDHCLDGPTCTNAYSEYLKESSKE